VALNDKGILKHLLKKIEKLKQNTTQRMKHRPVSGMKQSWEETFLGEKPVKMLFTKFWQMAKS